MGSNIRREEAVLSLVPAISILLAMMPPSGAAMITEAYNGLRSQPAVYIGARTTEQVGNRTGSSQAALYFQGGSLWKLELLEDANGTLLRRSVGDGRTFSSWRPGFNEYLSATYGAWNGNLPENYRPALMQAVSQISTGHAVYLTRLLREIAGGEYAEFRAWVPGATEYILQEGHGAHTDPISGRRFVPSPNREFVGYQLGSPVRRTVVFERSRIGGTWTLSHVYLADSGLLNNQRRTVDTEVTALGESHSSGDFVFQAPTGSKAIPLGRTAKGG